MTKFIRVKGKGLIATGEARNLKHLASINESKIKLEVEMTKDIQTKMKNFTDQYGSDDFYSDAPQLDIASVLGKQFVIKAAKIVEDFDGKFGTHDFAVLCLADIETHEIVGTVITSGQVVLKKIRKALADGVLPLVGTLVKDQRYYNII